MKRLLVVTVFCSAACAAGVANSGSFSGLAPSLMANTSSAPRYTNDNERAVSEIAGSILNIAAFADRFEPGDAFHVRNVSSAGADVKFSLQRRAEVFTVQVRSHVWVPRAYGRVATSFMADGAGLSISEDPATDQGGPALGTDAPIEAIAAENLRLSRLLQRHPRAPALHERAALLLALAATRRATADAEIRPLLNRMTAHLAVARALHSDALSGDGQLAERLLSQLAEREAANDGAIEGLWPDGPVTFGEHPALSILPPL